MTPPQKNFKQLVNISPNISPLHPQPPAPGWISNLGHREKIIHLTNSLEDKSGPDKNIKDLIKYILSPEHPLKDMMNWEIKTTLG